jgi:NADH:ubiquinone oxidoreductase subunit 4 (subunit M)
VFAFVACSLIGLPALAGFPGSWLSTIAIFQTSIGALAGTIVARLLVTWAFLWMLQRMLLGRFRVPMSGGTFATLPVTEIAATAEPERPRISAATFESDVAERSPSAGAARVPTAPRDLAWSDLLALAPLLGMLLTLGLVPHLYVERIEPTVKEALHISREITTKESRNSADDKPAAPAKDEP